MDCAVDGSVGGGEGEYWATIGGAYWGGNVDEFAEEGSWSLYWNQHDKPELKTVCYASYGRISKGGDIAGNLKGLPPSTGT